MYHTNHMPLNIECVVNDTQDNKLDVTVVLSK